MRHFTTGAAARRVIRRSFSVLTPEQIDEGLDRFAALAASITGRGDVRPRDTDAPPR